MISRVVRLAEELSALLLPRYLRVLALGLLAFWGTGLVVALSGLDVEWIDRFARWGGTTGMDATGAMLSIVYVVWSGFIWFAARDPKKNRLFVAFTIAANVAHFALMTAMAVYMAGEIHHIYLDTLLGWLAIIPLAVLFWLARRRDARIAKPFQAEDFSPDNQEECS